MAINERDECERMIARLEKELAAIELEQEQTEGKVDLLSDRREIIQLRITALQEYIGLG